MRILYIIPSLEGGGAENQLRLLAKHLSSKGNEVWVIYLHKSINESSLLDSSINRICLNIDNNYSWRIIANLYSLIKKISPDVIQTWITQVDIILGLIAFKLRINWIVREPSDKLSRNQNLKLKFRKWLCRKNRAVIVSNSKQGLLYWENSGLELNVIRNGYELGSFDLPKRISKEFKYEIICVGRLEPSKNVLLLIELLNRMPSDILDNMRLTIVGDGSLKHLVDNSIAKFVIRSTGYISDKSRLLSYYSASDIYCSLSASEGMPNTVVEAGLSGLLLLTSDIPSHRELLPADYPFFLNLSDSDSIVSIIKNAILLEQSKKCVYQNNVKKLFSNYSIDEVSEQYLDLYNRHVNS